MDTLTDLIPWVVGAAGVWFAIVLIGMILVIVVIWRTYRDIRRDHDAMDERMRTFRQRRRGPRR